MSDDVVNHDRRFVLRGRHLALALCLVLVGSVVLCFVARKSSLERRLKALWTAGYPTNFAELAEYTKLPEGAENAAPVYTRAFAAFLPPVDEANVPVLGKAKLPDRGVPLPEPMAQAVSKCLAANRQCLALLHDAASVEHCRYMTDYWPGIPQSHVQEMRRCAQLLYLDALLHAQQGDAEAVIVCVQDGLRLSDSLRREPALVNHLVRISVVALALNGLERSLSLTAFTERQLEDVGAALTRTAGALDFTNALVTERCFMIEACRDPSLLGLGGTIPPVYRLPSVRGTWLADTLDSMEDRIEASRLPPRERLKRFRQADDELQHLSFVHVMAKIVTPALTRVAELDLRVRAHLSLAQTALALERYRRATGRVPEQLQELVPRYLEQVPIDPFDGQPIRYRGTSPGYLLYSIDRDGRDNGGRERDDARKDEPYDLCFLVAR